MNLLSFLFLGSVVGLKGNSGQSVYSASKGGLVGFSRALAKEVAKKKTNYFWTYNDTTETFDEYALKQLDTLHKRNIGFSTILISSIVFTIGLLVSPVIKSFNPNKSKTPTEVVNKFDSIKNNLTTDTLDLTKPFVKK